MIEGSFPTSYRLQSAACSAGTRYHIRSSCTLDPYPLADRNPDQAMCSIEPIVFHGRKGVRLSNGLVDLVTLPA